MGKGKKSSGENGKSARLLYVFFLRPPRAFLERCVDDEKKINTRVSSGTEKNKEKKR